MLAVAVLMSICSQAQTDTIMAPPNVFTPNSDGINDYFQVVNDASVTDYELVVVNRWGQQVFQSTFPIQAWDGTHHGLPCREGVYFWQAVYKDASGTAQENRGSITLFR